MTVSMAEERTARLNGAGKGKVTETVVEGKRVLAIDRAKVGINNVPNIRVVDSKGQTHVLTQNKVPGKVPKNVAIPDNIGDVVCVQIFCSLSHRLLGEAKYGLK